MEYLSDYTPVENTSYRYINNIKTGSGGLFNSYTNALSKGYSGDYSDFIYSFERQSNKSGFNGYIRIPASTFNHAEFTPDYTTVWDHKFIVIWVGNRPMDNAAGGGGMPGWASDVNTGINAFGVANSAKTELIDYAVRSNYKSARTWSEFNNLRSSQQAWRTTNTLGKTGASYLKYAKGLGYVGAGLTTAYTVTSAYNYYKNGGSDWSVYAKSGIDVIMTGVGFLGPIGFGISATYFILDATTGGFGGFGQIKP